mgnify:CR=1 FL=1
MADSIIGALSCFVFNARSIVRKVLDLYFEVILQLDWPDVIAISETWLNSEVPDSIFSACKGYSVFRRDRSPGKKGGGVAILTKTGLACYSVNVPSDSCLEALCVQIQGKCQNLLFCVIYRPPGAVKECVQSMSRLLIFLESFQLPVVLTGDINLPDIDWHYMTSPNSFSSEICRSLLTHGFFQFVSEPTRSKNLLDVVLCTDLDLIQSTKVSPPVGNSDHFSVSFKINVASKPPVLKRKFLQWDKADYVGFSIALECVPWETLLGSRTINGMWTNFESCLLSLIDVFVPSTFVSVSGGSRKPSLPNRLKNALNRKRQLFEAKKLDPSPENKLRLKKWSHNCRSLLSGFQKVNESRFIENPDRKQFFRYVNSKLRSRSSIDVIEQGSCTLVDDQAKCEAFNDYYSSVFIDDDGVCLDLPDLGIADLPEFLITRSVVSQTLNALANNTSFGPDEIPSCVLKNLAVQLSVPLQKIFNISLCLGKLPDKWKMATVCPLYKGKGSRSLLDNYRPISLTSVCCKSLERILKRKITSHVISMSIISDSQHGFLQNRSTQTQLLECLNDWTSALDERIGIDAIYLDIKKAFDTVSHKKLVAVLSNYGIRGNVLRWIIDFLSNRRQRVRINSSYSDFILVRSGVPQGSVLGPLLFILYINDICRTVVHCSLKIFADDTKVYFRVRCPSDQTILEIDLENVFLFLSQRQLSVAFQKCSFLPVGGGLNLNLSYSLGFVAKRLR